MREKEQYQCLGLADGEVRLVPFRPEWAAAFYQESKLLKQKLGEFQCSIEHVGSTAIPDIVSKPIVDIALGVVDFSEFERLQEATEQIGYLYRGELGLKGRHFFKFVDDGLTRFHLHVVVLGSEHWKNMVLFRELLLKDQACAKEYAEVKTKLQERYANDRTDYTESKSPIIERLLCRAKALGDTPPDASKEQQ